jgi:hypothetical protein
MTINQTASIFGSPLPRSVAMATFALFTLLAVAENDRVKADDADAAWIAEIDLGVDVSGFKTPEAIRAFLAGVDAKTARVVMNACEHYIEAPGAIIGPDTLSFCSIAVAR